MVMKNMNPVGNKRSLVDWDSCRTPRQFGYLTLLVVSVLITCSPATSSDLDIQIQCEDTILDKNQVLISMTFTNIGDSDIVLYSFNDKVQPSMGGILHFQVIHNDTDTLICSSTGAIPKYPHERDTATLAPGQIYLEEVSLTSYYVSRYVEDHRLWDTTSYRGTRVWQPGAYKVRCTYEYRHKPTYKGGQDLWQGTATSNEIHFVVTD
jgi:hypothetical protein